MQPSEPYTSKTAHRKDSSRDGQALVEMVAGLVAILLLLVGLLQIGRIAHAHTATMMEAREIADVRAMDGQYHLHLTAPLFIDDWDEGSDGLRYTQQDTPISGSAYDIQHTIVHQARPAELASYIGNNDLNDVVHSQHFSDGLYFVRGQSQSQRIPFYPIMRRLITTDESIRMHHTVWMPWTQRGQGAAE